MSGLFKSRSSTTTQDQMLTPEQKAAMATLSQIGQTGSGAGINLGDAYTGSLGDFNMTGTQDLASNKLYDLINSGNPSGYDTARNTLTGLANNTFNPNDPSSGYNAYANQANRAFNTSNDVLNREASITGDRFSTAILKNKQDLAAQHSDLLANKLAELYNTAQDRSLNAANSLGNLETQQGNNTRSNLAAGFDPSQGGLQNTLNNVQANASYNEFQRQRNEKLKQIDVLSNVFNKNVPYGQMSSTTNAPSIFSSILGQVNPLIGGYNTAKYGTANAPNQSSFADLTKIALSLAKGGM